MPRGALAGIVVWPTRGGRGGCVRGDQPRRVPVLAVDDFGTILPHEHTDGVGEPQPLPSRSPEARLDSWGSVRRTPDSEDGRVRHRVSPCCSSKASRSAPSYSVCVSVMPCGALAALLPGPHVDVTLPAVRRGCRAGVRWTAMCHNLHCAGMGEGVAGIVGRVCGAAAVNGGSELLIFVRSFDELLLEI
jgi:hypothetical protein